MKRISFTLIWAYFLLPNDAFAYIDPGAGSAFLSAIIGAVVGGGVFLRHYFHKISALFKRVKR